MDVLFEHRLGLDDFEFGGHGIEELGRGIATATRLARAVGKTNDQLAEIGKRAEITTKRIGVAFAVAAAKAMCLNDAK